MTIAILAGGASSRFGQDKATLFLPRVLAACQPLNLPIVIVGRSESDLELPTSAACLPDAFPGQGPLGGLITALRHTDGPVLLLPCDLAFLETAALLWLLAQWEQSPKDLPVISTESLTGIQGDVAYEPLFSVYPQSSLDHAESLLTNGRRSMHQLLKHQGYQEALLPEHLLPQLRNINTPEDLTLR